MALVIATGCGGGSETTGTPGQETGPCVDNACFPGLSCLSNLCVDADGTGPMTASSAPMTGDGPSSPSSPSSPTSPEPTTSADPPAPTTDEPDPTAASGTSTGAPNVPGTSTGEPPDPTTGVDDVTTETRTSDAPATGCKSQACKSCNDEKCATWYMNCQTDAGCQEFQACVEETCCTDCIFDQPCGAIFSKHPAAFNMMVNILDCTAQYCADACAP